MAENPQPRKLELEEKEKIRVMLKGFRRRKKK